MSRRRIAVMLALAALCAETPSLAQDGATGSPPQRIDLTIQPGPARISASCKRRQEAALISGEIVVCGSGEEEGARDAARDDARRRYAEKTAFRDQPATPDVAGAGIFRGPATFGGLCVKGILNCPRPPALIVDVTKLPQAPPGSDADRIARGLEPLGNDGPRAARPLSDAERAELGLPAPLTPAGSDPSGSAAPAAPQ